MYKRQKSTIAGILARVNLKMAGYPLNKTERFEEARKWALVVMDTQNGHELNPDYKQIFINHCQDIYDTKECLWEVEFGKVATGGQEEEGSLGAITGIGNSDKAFGYSYGAMRTTERYYRSFEEGDLRRDWTINNYYYGTVNGISNTHEMCIRDRRIRKHIRTLIIVSIPFFTTLIVKAQQMLPYQNPQLSVEERVNDLLGRMTLEEKIGQITHLHSYKVFDGQELNPNKLEVA